MPLWKFILTSFILSIASVCVVEIACTETWEEHFKELAYGFAALIGYFYPYEWSSWHGQAVGNSDDVVLPPEDWVKIIASLTLILIALNILF